MTLSEIERLARRLMAEHGATGWTFAWDNAVRRAGACHYGHDRQGRKVRKITLSKKLLPLWPAEEIRNTILHEIAHALAFDQHGSGVGHDFRWQRIARSIGCTGDRCYNGNLPGVKAPWVGTCRNGHTSERHSKPERVHACGQCARVYQPENIYRWKKDGRPMSAAQIGGRYAQEWQVLVVKYGDRLPSVGATEPKAPVQVAACTSTNTPASAPTFGGQGALF